MKWAANRLVGLLTAIPFLAALGTAHAQNATWGTSPGTSDWNTNTNWTPQTVPSGTATFGSSNTTSITFSANGGTGSIGEILFNAGAPAYSFSFSGAFQALTITGVGIVSNSSNISTFFNAAGGTLVFRNTSAAGNATIINNSNGFTRFFNTSTAGNAVITTNNAGTTVFSNASTGGNATITNNGGSTVFFNTSTGGNATITTLNGGLTQFFDTSTGGQARFITNVGGVVDFSATIGPASDRQITAGSIEGIGDYRLGANTLTTGLNNLSTEVSGTIADGGQAGSIGGSLIKVGTGTLTLSGTNTYTGGTTISAGMLQLGNGGASGSIPGNVVDNGVFAINRSDAFTFGGIISGTGSFQQLGNGTTILSAANSYSGAQRSRPACLM